MGHFARECPQPRQENRGNRGGGFSSVTRRGGFSSGRSDNEQNGERSGFGSASTRGTTGGFRGTKIDEVFVLLNTKNHLL